MARVIFLLIILVIEVTSENIVSVKDTTIWVNQIFPLTIEMSNTDTIVGFQLDVELPTAIEYIDSFSVSSRLKSHQVNIRYINESTVRILSYSITNSPITGKSGPVVKIFCCASEQTGVFEVRLKNGILANPYSCNVLDSLRNGLIQIIEQNDILDHNERNVKTEIYLYPNPFNGQLNINFYSYPKEPVKIYFYNILGEMIFHKIFPPEQTGWKENSTMVSNLPSGNYIVIIKLGSKCIKKKITLVK